MHPTLNDGAASLFLPYDFYFTMHYENKIKIKKIELLWITQQTQQTQQTHQTQQTQSQ
jgi:hypothetical protein